MLVLVSDGDIAQLGERRVRIAEVGGSNPPISSFLLVNFSVLQLLKSAQEGSLAPDLSAFEITNTHFVTFILNEKSKSSIPFGACGRVDVY